MSTLDAVRLARAAALLAQNAGIDPSASPRAADAFKLIDGEAVSSLPGLVNVFRQRRAAIDADQTLSDLGKREQLRAFANSHLGNIATKARRVVELESEYAKDRASAVPLPKADASETLIDLALAQHIRSTEPIPTALMTMSERVRLAIARVPVELSGLTAETQARVHGSLMNPAKALQFATEAQAIGAAREVTQAAIDEIATHAEWPAAELVRHFGTHWRLPGVADSSAATLATDSK